jgi:hypothetical protein
MRRVLVAVAWLALSMEAAAAEWPPPAELPLRAALPDPLVMFDGTAVATRDQWATQRKPELRELFEHYMYGRYPAVPDRVTGRTLFEDRNAFDGVGTLREVEITFGPPEWPKIYLLIASPNADAPSACFVGMNFGGNHLRTDDERVRLPTVWMPEEYPGVVDHRATDAGRGKQNEEGDRWPLAEIVRRGYAVATFYCGDVQPDRPDVQEGMRATMPAETVDDASQNDGAATASIMWWAWGIHRAVDYLATDPAIDAKRIAVVGHSRLGKTALLAGAFDDRIALVIPNQAGSGGSGPSRHDDPRAETVAIITDHFPHWFCKNFSEFADDPSRLPFDQNCLVTLCAPRPVLFTAADDDVWANPSGQFEVLQAASPVYELLGVQGLEASEMPEAGDPLIASRLGYWIRPGRHAFHEEDWATFMDFADKWLK